MMSVTMCVCRRRGGLCRPHPRRMLATGQIGFAELLTDEAG